MQYKNNLALKTVKKHFNNTANTEKGTDEQKLKQIKTDIHTGLFIKC